MSTLDALPTFQNIDLDNLVSELEQLLNENRRVLEEILAMEVGPTRENFLYPLEVLDDRLSQFFSPISHLNSVKNSEELRAVYEQCLPMLTAYHTEMGQNKKLYETFLSLQKSQEFSSLNQAEKKIVSDSVRDFMLSGVNLEGKDKESYAEHQEALSQLSNSFGNNIMDATEGWHTTVAEESRLEGLPEAVKQAAKIKAEEAGEVGYRFGLDFPTYYAIVSQAKDRALRKACYQAYVSRASDKGPSAGQWDNSPVMTKILAHKQALAQLLGFQNYAEYSLSPKMASSTQEVLGFYDDLIKKAKPAAEKEFQELKAFAAEAGLEGEMQPWDVAFYSEKLQESRYSISQEALRPYFPINTVLSGLFDIVSRLFDVTISEESDIETWHPDVRFFHIQENTPEAKTRGYFYLDLYARNKKRGGAWMDECLSRFQMHDALQHPVAYLVTNFRPGTEEVPACLTHDDMVTLFHEFGHGLHHMLTQVDLPSVSGISGVPWDAVELPSQFLENWCWTKEGLALCSSHIETQESLPEELIEKLCASQTFQAAMGLVRQVELGLFDFKIHLSEKAPSSEEIQGVLESVRDRVAVTPRYPEGRFQNGFSHIFAGGYSAGYYSYLWAEVLSADAFSAFEEAGIFDAATGERFRKTILEQGGSRDIAELFEAFRGRKPTVDALLRQKGLS